MRAMTGILVDASALVPFVVREDQWHPALRRTLIVLRSAGAPAFLTTNWTLYEALAVSRRRGAATSARLHDLVRGTMNVVAVPAGVEAEALDRFLSWRDKLASVVDHANLLVAQRFGCEAILSFDVDFVPLVRSAGIRLIGMR